MRRRRVSATLLASALLVFFGGVAPQDAWAAPLPPPLAASAGIEPLSGYEPQTVCDPTDKPGAILLANLLTRTYPGTTASISRPCTGGTSEHFDGRAIDWMTSMRTPAGLDRGNAMITWMLATDAAGNSYANARRLGVMYLIWNDKIWAAYRPADGWRPYSTCAAHPEVAADSACHRNHVHTSLSTLGASGTTSYWVGSTVVPSVLGAGAVVRSPNGRFLLAMQADGNLVTYSGSQAIWSSGTFFPHSSLHVQSDGNAVIYGTTEGLALWSPVVYSPGGRLEIQNDGNLVLYSAGHAPLWDSQGNLGRTALRWNPQRAVTALASGAGATTYNEAYRLVMQGDGNLVLYTAAGRPLWWSGTARAGSRFVVQSDGNAVIYDPAAYPVWNTATSTPRSTLLVQNDGYIVLYDPSNRAVWRSK